MEITFFIPSCIRTLKHKEQLLRCINSIRNFHKSEIIIIETGGGLIDITDIGNSQLNIRIIQPLPGNLGELQPFYFIQKESKTEINITMHDSMLLNKKIEEWNQEECIKFLWHATNHIIQWDTIEEPKCEYNTAHNIISHSDLILHLIKKNFSSNFDFIMFSKMMMENKHLWVLCVGVSVLITKTYLKHLEQEYDIVNIFITFDNRRWRTAAESIMAILCFWDFFKNRRPPGILFSSIAGCVYDGFSINPMAGKIYVDDIVYMWKTEYFTKISFGRD